MPRQTVTELPCPNCEYFTGDGRSVRVLICRFHRLAEGVDGFIAELERMQADSDREARASSGPPKAWPLMMAGDVARRLRRIRVGGA
jgi:hypothetical protein